MSYYKKDGTLYSITGGLTKHWGSIEKLEVGLTKVDGTVYEIDLQQPLITETQWELQANTSDPTTYSGTWVAPYSGYYRITTIGGGGGGAGTMCVAGVCNWKESELAIQYKHSINSDLAIGGGGAGGSGQCNQFIVKLRRREPLGYTIGRGGAGGSNKLIALTDYLGVVNTSNVDYNYFTQNPAEYTYYKGVSADGGEDGTSSIVYSQYHDIYAQAIGGEGGLPGIGDEEATSWDTLMLSGAGGEGSVDGEDGSLKAIASYSAIASQGGTILSYANIGAGGNGGCSGYYTGDPTGSLYTMATTVFMLKQEPTSGADGGIIIEYLEEDTTLTPEYLINYDCSNAIIENHVGSALAGSGYTNTITALEGYAFDAYTITMNGEDISQYCTPSPVEYYTTKIFINIPSITGDIYFSCQGAPLLDVKISISEEDQGAIFLNGTWYGTSLDPNNKIDGECGTDMHQLVIKDKMPSLQLYSYVGHGSADSSGWNTTGPIWHINGSIKEFIVDKPIAIIAKTSRKSTDTYNEVATTITVQYQESDAEE